MKTWWIIYILYYIARHKYIIKPDNNSTILKSWRYYLTTAIRLISKCDKPTAWLGWNRDVVPKWYIHRAHRGNIGLLQYFEGQNLEWIDNFNTYHASTLKSYPKIPKTIYIIMKPFKRDGLVIQYETTDLTWPRNNISRDLETTQVTSYRVSL